MTKVGTQLTSVADRLRFGVVALIGLSLLSACDGPVVIDTTGNPAQERRGQIRGQVVIDPANLAALKGSRKLGTAADSVTVANAVVVLQNDFERVVTATNGAGIYSAALSAGGIGISAWVFDDAGLAYARFATHTVRVATSATVAPLLLAAAGPASGTVRVPDGDDPRTVSVRQRWTDWSVASDARGGYHFPILIPGAELVAAAPGLVFDDTLIGTTRADEGVIVAISIAEQAARLSLTSWIVGELDLFTHVDGLAPSQLSVSAGTYTLRTAQPGLPHINMPLPVAGGVSASVALASSALVPVTGLVSGVAKDALTGLVIAGATVRAVGQTTTSGDDGGWTMALPAGCHAIMIEASGYASATLFRCVGGAQSAEVGTVVLDPASPCVAALEVCDGVDNDCDGVVDQAPICTIPPQFAEALTFAAVTTVSDGNANWLSVVNSEQAIFAIVQPVCPCDAATRGTLLELDLHTLETIAAYPLTAEGLPLETAYDSGSHAIFISVAKRVMGSTTAGPKRIDRFDLATRSLSTLTETVDQDNNSGIMRLQVAEAHDTLFLLNRELSGPVLRGYDTTSGAAKGVLQLPGVASDFDYSDLTDRLYIAQAHFIVDPPNRLNVVDPVTMGVQLTVPTGLAPASIDISLNQRWAIITGGAPIWDQDIGVVDLDPASPTFHSLLSTTTTEHQTFNRFLFFADDTVVLGTSNQAGNAGLVSFSATSSGQSPPVQQSHFDFSGDFLRTFKQPDPTIGMGYLTDGPTIRRLVIGGF